MSSDDVIAALRARHPDPEWAFIVELRCGVGYNTKAAAVFDEAQGDWVKVPNAHEQRLDAWALCTYPSKGMAAITYEVKVSRADFLRELKDPSKRELGLAYSNQFYFAAPKGLIRPAELPSECGLIEVYPSGQARTRVPAPERAMEPLPLLFVAAIARRAGRVGQMPTDKSVAEKELTIAREQSRDAQAQMQEAQQQRDMLAAQTHALLVARGWVRVHGNYRLADDSHSYGLRDALAVELSREGASVAAATVVFPTAAELEERFGVYLAADGDGETLLRRVRRAHLEQGAHELAPLAAAIFCACLSPRNIHEQRGRVALEAVDLFLSANEHRLEGDQGVLHQLVQETIELRSGQAEFAAAQLAPLIVAGSPAAPFRERYPQLGLRD